MPFLSIFIYKKLTLQQGSPSPFFLLASVYKCLPVSCSCPSVFPLFPRKRKQGLEQFLGRLFSLPKIMQITHYLDSLTQMESSCPVDSQLELVLKSFHQPGNTRQGSIVSSVCNRDRMVSSIEQLPLGWPRLLTSLPGNILESFSTLENKPAYFGAVTTSRELEFLSKPGAVFVKL